MKKMGRVTEGGVERERGRREKATKRKRTRRIFILSPCFSLARVLCAAPPSSHLGRRRRRHLGEKKKNVFEIELPHA